MAGLVESFNPPLVEEKNGIMPQDSNDLERRYSHWEIAHSGSNETRDVDSEKDIPVLSHFMAHSSVNELTALAATSEMAPIRKRGVYVAALIFTILPFCPAVLWAQLIAYHSSWRYVGAFCGAWSGFGLLITVLFYFPPPRVNSTGLSRKEIISRVDFIGGFLSITGLIVFLAGLQWGGYQYPWSSAHVLTPLIVGVALLVAFTFWEIYGAKYPIFPTRLKQEPRTLCLTLVVTFISGANFFSVLMFWPTESFNVYGHNPVDVGVRSLPIGFGILGGACIVLVLLSDLIATISALTLSIRVVGGGIGYTIYYNVFVSKFVPLATHYIGGVMTTELNITSVEAISIVIELTGASLLDEIKTIPGIAGNETAYQMVVAAGQVAYAESYKWVYYTSIAFGAISIIASCFLGNITKYMTDHVAVVM
ncbi:hypothetical protein N7495_007484 [Penicillium taxi]|uniref:uncharacterized protein n=1 Tax=Penicillium taxi TaxID=168475 RepID=UPI0025451CC4|nr:uncharacterized protein N7495_007484 [Penicillium taxi]KAJ5887443.1 hypothetical protein N7495_007484 [Penicillium taxi]